MIKNIVIVFIVGFLFPAAFYAQNTVGLLSFDEAAIYPGYNLIFPHNQPNVYLLNNCGEIVHSWEDDANFVPGNAVYILENGDLVKCKRDRDHTSNFPIWGGGGGETLEVRTWDNDLLYSLTMNNAFYRLHHDVEPLPNGNILAIAWAKKSNAQCIAAGRNPEIMSTGEVWTERIFEWNPISGRIVWEWDAFDHLIQDFDSTKANYGVVSEHPELIDFNYDTHRGHPDWLHINSIDYNPVLDQIMLSVPYFDELWIIDHSTTTEEAMGHTGGNSGRGGDLLYRWGNPAAYQMDTITNKKLFFQHDLRWINPDAQPEDEDFGKVSLYNNRVAFNGSTANIVATIQEGDYQMSNGTFLPSDHDFTIKHPSSLARPFSNALSSTQVLPNGNFLMISGRFGFAYELTPEADVVWEYLVPIATGERATQGDSLFINSNITFKIDRYALDNSIFEGRDLSPKGFLELNPNEGFCTLVNTASIIENSAVELFPNPVQRSLYIQAEHQHHVYIYDVFGRKVQEMKIMKGERQSIDVSNWQKGVYYLQTELGDVQVFIVQ